MILRERLWLVLWGVYFAGLAFSDWRKKSYPLAVGSGGILCAEVAAWIRYPQISGGTILAENLIGLGFLLFSFLSGEKLGYGDAVALWILFLIKGVEKGMTGCVVAFLLAALRAIWLLAVKKKTKNEPLIFLPWLFVGYLV